MTSRPHFGAALGGQRLSAGSCLAATILLSSALPVHAQTQTQPQLAEASGEAEGLQTVTVTAR
jgi:hypothetical protein